MDGSAISLSNANPAQDAFGGGLYLPTTFRSDGSGLQVLSRPSSRVHRHTHPYAPPYQKPSVPLSGGVNVLQPLEAR
jgi:hypothetical protein